MLSHNNIRYPIKPVLSSVLNIISTTDDTEIWDLLKQISPSGRNLGSEHHMIFINSRVVGLVAQYPLHPQQHVSGVKRGLSESVGVGLVVQYCQAQTQPQAPAGLSFSFNPDFTRPPTPPPPPPPEK